MPARAFEALLLAAGDLGDVADDDPPYVLWVRIAAPACWCRLDVVPDAGASSVSLALGSTGDGPPPPIDLIRNLWIDRLNDLDWSAI